MEISSDDGRRRERRACGYWILIVAIGISVFMEHRPVGSPNAGLRALSSSEALEAIEAADGFSVTLAADEALVHAPVAGAFDEDGRLWVVEMTTYMQDIAGTGELEPRNRIVVLSDSDGDGVFDESKVFLDGLVLPRAVAPCHGGALVIEPPRLLFCRDSDGDGVCDERRVLATGFEGRESPEHAGNGLIYGLDNWWKLSQHGFEYRFDGREVESRPTPIVGQWGITQDDAGRLYYSPNSTALIGDEFPKHYASRNGHVPGIQGIGRSLVKSSAVWPARPTPGVNRGYQANVLREDGTLQSMTGACAPHVINGHGLGADAIGDVLVCDAAGNLVKRLALSWSDGRCAATDRYSGAEFLRSLDERFRPVALLGGPDGAVYVLDMARGLIQHRVFLTDYLKAHVAQHGLEKPVDLGRIWRVAGTDAVAAGASPRLSTLSDEQLVSLLDHPDGWWREQARRLLVERRAVGVADSLRHTMRAGVSRGSCLAAAWVLEGIDALHFEDLVNLLGSEDEAVRENGARLAERFGDDRRALGVLLTLTTDASESVRLQAVHSLGGIRGVLRADAESALLSVIGSARNERLVHGALSGLKGRESWALSQLLRRPGWPANSEEEAAARAVAACLIRGEAPDRLFLLEMAGELACNGDRRAGLFVRVVAAEQRLDGDAPRVISILGTPRAWLGACKQDGPLRAIMTESTEYFDWPGRPPVVRRSIIRKLTGGEAAAFERGRRIYATCAGCHRHDGGGSPGQAPSLSGSILVQGSKRRLAALLMMGMEGPFVHQGAAYSGSMPPAPVRTDEDLAAVMTYIRRSFGNQADPVSAAEVAESRKTVGERSRPWTRDELDVVR